MAERGQLVADQGVALPGREWVEEWHPADGTRWLVAEDGRFPLDFPPGASHLLVSRERTDVPFKPDRGRLVKQIPLAESWEMIRKDRNVLVLDYCRVKKAGQWGPRLPVWKAARWIQQGKEEELRLRYEFEIGSDWDPATTALELVVEELRSSEIRVNGQRLGAGTAERWIDPVFEIAALDGCVFPGLNEIDIVWTDDFKNRFEPVYVRGDFVLRKQGSGFVLARESGESALGDLAARGYPFYTGTVVYRKNFHLDERAGDAVLVFAELGGVVYDVYLNDRHAGTAAWAPYELSLDNSLSPGENRIEIHVVGSLRNLFGPHHNTQTFYPCVEGSWTDEAHWTDEYLCEPFGLLSAPHIHLFK